MKILNFFVRLGIVLVVLGLLLTIGWMNRARLLRGAAEAWIVNDTLTQSDAIVVLGGGLDTRPLEAARLFHLGLAPKILLTNPKPRPSALMGLIPADADSERSMLLKKDVPAANIFITDEFVTDSYEESIAVGHWAQAEGIKRIIIPTDIFHTRRVRWLFNKELRPLDMQVEVDAVPVLEYTVNDWWMHDAGVIGFQNEILKYAYYRIKY